MIQSATAKPLPHTGKALNITVWALQIVVALAFFAAGAGKLSGSKQMVEMFAKIGAGQWLRYLTGILEIAGAIALLVPRTAFYGAALLAAVMTGAIGFHAAVLGGSPVPAIVLLSLTGTIAYLRRPQERI